MTINPSEYKFQNYIVGIIDVMGQSNALEKLSDIPGIDRRDSYIEVARATVGNVLKVRDAVEKFFDSFYAYKASPDVQQLSAEQRLEYDSLRGHRLVIQQFSDTILCYAPINNDTGINVAVVNALFASFASTILMSLASKIPIRGGIDRGIAVELRGGDIYGPALLRAYHQESKVAIFPRIVVGTELLTFIDTYKNAPETSKRNMFNKSMAYTCNEMLAKDANGVVFLDYLGRFFRDALRGPNLWPAIQSAHQFANEQSSRFENDEPDEKLAVRYQLLLNYISSSFPELNNL